MLAALLVQTTVRSRRGGWINQLEAIEAEREFRRRSGGRVAEELRELYYGLEDTPQEVAAEAVVAPYREPTPAAQINWAALAAHADAVQRLLELYRQRDEEETEEMLLLMH